MSKKNLTRGLNLRGYGSASKSSIFFGKLKPTGEYIKQQSVTWNEKHICGFLFFKYGKISASCFLHDQFSKT